MAINIYQAIKLIKNKGDDSGGRRRAFMRPMKRRGFLEEVLWITGNSKD